RAGGRTAWRWALCERRWVIQKTRQMYHLDIGPGRAQARCDLKNAPRIRAHDHVGACLEDPRDLLALQLGRDRRMREVVDARAAAAALGVTDLDERHAVD